jgi:glycosyltransferase involved in cell wall biosynthesis
MPLRVALLSPFAPPSVRGNAVTVSRIAHGLRARAVDVRVWDLSTATERSIADEAEAYAPSLVHAFHAYRTGPFALRLARRAELPLIVTLTGTDANRDLFDAARAATVRRVLEGATRITVFHDSIAERVTAALPDVSTRLVVVAQAAALEAGDPFDIAQAGFPGPQVLFVFLGGLRPVKRPRLPLRAFDRVVARSPAVRLLYAGPVIDPDEGDALLRELRSRPWARHVGTVPHRQVGSLLARADVVLNCSSSEGGMANSVLEALAMERAVLASDIPGNRSLIEHGVTGLLFANDTDLEEHADGLAHDPALRARLGRAGRERVEAEYPPAREIDGYMDVYRALTPVASP